jgi:hypothetical protein
MIQQDKFGQRILASRRDDAWWTLPLEVTFRPLRSFLFIRSKVRRNGPEVQATASDATEIAIRCRIRTRACAMPQSDTEYEDSSYSSPNFPHYAGDEFQVSAVAFNA